MSSTSGKAEAWAMFDRIVEQAAADESPGTNPWRFDETGQTYAPGYVTLRRLLAVPLLFELCVVPASVSSGDRCWAGCNGP